MQCKYAKMPWTITKPVSDSDYWLLPKAPFVLLKSLGLKHCKKGVTNRIKALFKLELNWIRIMNNITNKGVTNRIRALWLELWVANCQELPPTFDLHLGKSQTGGIPLKEIPSLSISESYLKNLLVLNITFTLNQFQTIWLRMAFTNPRFHCG